MTAFDSGSFIRSEVFLSDNRIETYSGSDRPQSVFKWPPGLRDANGGTDQTIVCLGRFLFRNGKGLVVPATNPLKSQEAPFFHYLR